MKTGLEQGKSFTQTLDDFNRANNAVQRVDVLEDGSLGARIHNESGTVKYWKQAGGEFTAQEQAHLDTNKPPAPRGVSQEAQAMGLHEKLSDAQVENVVEMSPTERAVFMKTQRGITESHINNTNTAIEPHAKVIRGMMPRPASLATGAAGAVGAHYIMQAIDPDQKLNSIASEGVEGAIAGGLTTGIAGAVGASAALGPEVLAGASAYLAGAESNKAITKALEKNGMKTSTAEAIGSVSGGAIGGTTAAAVGAGATVGLSTLAGVEIGEAVGLVGGPVGLAIGAAAGASIGAIVGGIGWLFSHH